MLEDEKDRQLDALLDSLLSAYSAAEPRSGLEIRIRARLQARAAQQRRRWVLLFAASVTIVVLAVWMTRARMMQPRVPDHVVVQEHSPELVPGAGTVSSSPQKATRPFAAARRSGAARRSNSQILLQVADALHRTDNVVFEREKLYLAPTPQPEPEPVIEQQPSAPRINIQDLGVQTIEIKELPSAKGIDSKGTL